MAVSKKKVAKSRKISIYAATLNAASFIEKNPALFQFWRNDIPRTCKSPGCAIGWIHFFGKRKRTRNGPNIINGAAAGLAVENSIFYLRMNVLAGERWSGNAKNCAAALRLYAAKYLKGGAR